MLVLIWVTLLFFATGAFPREETYCYHPRFCIRLIVGEITAEAGLCVVMPCSFTTSASLFTPMVAIWSKCEPHKQKCIDSEIIFHSNNIKKVQKGFVGRVSLLEPDITQNNCSIIINDLTESDSGSYQFRVNGRFDGFSFNPKANVNIKALSQKPTMMVPELTEGQQTTLTCIAPGRCSGSAPKITWMWREQGQNESHISGNSTAFKTENVTAVTQRHTSTLTFNPSAKHHGTEVTCKVSFIDNMTTEETVTLNVSYTKKPEITGRRMVKEGDAVNLTCSVESFPPSTVTWTKHGCNKNLHNEIKIEEQNNTVKATLLIPNMTGELSGRYICTVKHMNKAQMENADITLMLSPEILDLSVCVLQSELLTCVCISQGVPLPSIKWPLLENHTNYFLSTAVSNYTVNSIMILPVKHDSTTVECVGSNEIAEVKGNLTITKNNLEQEDQSSGFSWLEIILAFFTGAVASSILVASICCLAKIYYRKKMKSSRNLAETQEMVTSEENQLIDDGQTVENHQIHHQEADEGGAEEEGGGGGEEKGGGEEEEEEEKSAPDCDGEPNDVEYAMIDFSLLKRKSLSEAAKQQETTEYAEIKKKERLDSEMLEREEEDSMIGDEEIQYCMPEEEESEDVALYYNVEDIMVEQAYIAEIVCDLV
ncbi:hypothetical protein LDENG_00074460 [Lucifuga dentata]|nr:hypothetical protein LDENG_00074460 [Lucifuga dentata]